MLSQGVLIVEEDIPDWLIWLNRIALHRYVFNGMAVNEFTPDEEYDSPIFPDGGAVREYFSIEDDEYGRDVGVTLTYTAIFYALAYAALKLR